MIYLARLLHAPVQMGRIEEETVRIPVLHMGHPKEQFWLTDERPVSPAGQPVLIDAAGQVYRPANVPEVIVVRVNTCNQVFYNAAEKAGYKIGWID